MTQTMTTGMKIQKKRQEMVAIGFVMWWGSLPCDHSVAHPVTDGEVQRFS
jgi:hypothetical protein